MNPALTAWLGGVLTWIVAAVFDYLERDSRFDRERARVEGELKGKPAMKEDVGEDIDQYVATLVGGEPTWSRSFLETYSEPLFVAALVGATTVFTGPNGDEPVAWAIVICIVATVALRLLNARKRASKYLRRWVVVIPVWLALLVGLVCCRHEAHGSVGGELASLLAEAHPSWGVVVAVLGGVVLGVLLGRWSIVRRTTAATEGPSARNNLAGKDR